VTMKDAGARKEDYKKKKNLYVRRDRPLHEGTKLRGKRGSHITRKHTDQGKGEKKKET